MRRVTVILAITAFAVAFVPSASAGGGCYWESSNMTEAAVSSDEVTAHIAGCRYEPTTLYIEPGTTVTWLNKDPVPHSVTGPFLTLGSDKLFDRGESTSVRFGEVGVFPYYCVLHSGMAASVVVGDPLEGKKGADAAPMAGGKYDPGPGTTKLAETTGGFPIVVGVAVIAVAGLAVAIFLVRKRRRAALPVPGALP